VEPRTIASKTSLMSGAGFAHLPLCASLDCGGLIDDAAALGFPCVVTMGPELLNEQLSAELTAINQYFLHAKNAGRKRRLDQAGEVHAV